MTALTRWEPMRELTTMRNVMDRMFDDFFGNVPAIWERDGERMSLALDVMEKPEAYVVKASVPGVKPENIEITVVNNVLTIKGESKEESEKKEGEYHLRERRFGSFYRSITLPMNVKPEAIEAVNEHGVLTLTLPKAEAVKPKKIAVKTVVNG
jgi:HSP20 family protein